MARDSYKVYCKVINIFSHLYPVVTWQVSYLSQLDSTPPRRVRLTSLKSWRDRRSYSVTVTIVWVNRSKGAGREQGKSTNLARALVDRAPAASGTDTGYGPCGMSRVRKFGTRTRTRDHDNRGPNTAGLSLNDSMNDSTNLCRSKALDTKL